MKTFLTTIGGYVLLALGACGTSAALADSVPPSANPAPATADAVARPADLSFAADQVVKLHEGGVDAKVISTYINSSQYAYQLSANDIVYMHSLGITTDTLSAMMKHDQERPQQPAVTANPAPAPTYTQPAPTAPSVVYAQPTYAAPVYTSPSVTVIGSDYSYPYYPYGYSYGSPFRVGIGLGFGFGYGHGYYRGGYGGYHHGGWHH